jgi:hypothetical protein
VSRPRLAIVRAGVGAVQIAAVVLALAIALGAIVATVDGVRPIAAIAVRWVALGVFLVALSTAASSAIDNELVAWLATFGAVMAYEATVQLTPLRAYPDLDLYRFAGASPGDASWAVAAGLVGAALGWVAVATWQLTRSEPRARGARSRRMRGESRGRGSG